METISWLKSKKSALGFSIAVLVLPIIQSGCDGKKTIPSPSVKTSTSINSSQPVTWKSYAGKEIQLRFRYPENFSLRYLADEGRIIAIENPEQPLSFNPEKKDTTAPQGLQIKIEMKPTKKAPFENKYLKPFANNPALKIVDLQKLAKDQKVHSPFLQAEYLYLGKENIYDITIKTANFTNDDEKIVNEILRSFHE